MSRLGGLARGTKSAVRPMAVTRRRGARGGGGQTITAEDNGYMLYVLHIIYHISYTISITAYIKY